MAYEEYYEHALTNGVLGIQRGKEPGVMIYMLPQAPGTSKAMGYHGWGNKTQVPTLQWGIKTGITTSLYGWITPIPSTYNSHLISLSQESHNASFVLTNLNHSVTMEALPKSGSDTTVQATFRLVSEDLKPLHSSSSLSSADLIRKSVMLEPMDFRSMVIVIQGPSSNLAVGCALGNIGSSTF
ncbi:hypothetical protein GIB67_040978 [Kingdonia uniflora]|uniref:Uncharacterized protein n=1 Tax=Kingdonia uniflora TaxID=39325 RepID=A0A7J7NC36_9MAGN|nr:hypothetical protein GIB67_040978 [Kingdonia uniflora]